MDYQHRCQTGIPLDLPVGQVICVGRNYAAHAVELNNPIPSEPVLFMKPPSAIQSLGERLSVVERFMPVHYETELAVLITQPLFDASESQVRAALGGMTLALDLTRREEQSRLKQKRVTLGESQSICGQCDCGGFFTGSGELGSGDIFTINEW